MRKYVLFFVLLFFLNLSFAQETRNSCNAEGNIWFLSLNKCCGNDGENDNFYGEFKWGMDYYCCNGNIRSEIDNFIEEIGNWPAESGAIYSSPAIMDLENDGRKEIVVGSILNRVPVWRYRSEYYEDKPELVGTGDADSSVYSSPVSADLDNDGSPEIIAVSKNKIYVWNNGLNELWSVEIQVSPDVPMEMSSPALADIDNDGDLEIFFGTSGGYVYGLHHDGSAVAGWEDKKLYEQIVAILLGSDGAPGIGSSPAIGDIDNDGSLEIVIGGSAMVHAFEIDGTPTFEIDLLTPSLGYQLVSTSSPALADLDNDGKLEIIVLSTPYEMGTLLLDQYLHVLKSNGDYFFQPVLIVSHEEVISNSASSPAVGDIDLDGNLEIVFTTDNGKIHAFEKKADGTWDEMDKFPVDAGGKAMSSPALADLDGDSDLEIIAGSFDGNLYAFDYEGNSFDGFPKFIGGEIFSSPAVGDLNGDGKLEIIVGTIEGELDGKMHVLSMETKGGSEWRKFGRNIKNSGYQSNIQKPSDCSKLCVDSEWAWIQGATGYFAPCCGDDEELDSWTTSNWVCEYGEAYGAPECGMYGCERGENCGTCPGDCKCLFNEECMEGVCEKVCPASCDDYNDCTLDKCSEETNYDCIYELIDNCCGNGKCEENEDCGNCLDDCPCPIGEVCRDNQCEPGCPESCDDGFICTIDFCDETTNYQCKSELQKPCCGDGTCDGGEDFTNCCVDCGCKEGETCVNNVCIVSGEIPEEECIEECQAVSAFLSCCAGLVSSNNICINCEGKKQASCPGKGLCIESCGAGPKCNRILPGTGNCNNNCSYVPPVIEVDPDTSQSECEGYNFVWIKDKCCGDDEGEIWSFGNGICYQNKKILCGEEDGFCLAEYGVECAVEDKDCTLPCLNLLPEQTIYIAENQPNAFDIEIASNCKQEFENIKIISSYLNLNQEISSFKPNQREKIEIARSFSKGEHLIEIQVLADGKEKKALIKVIAVKSSKLKEKISGVIDISSAQFKTFKDNINSLGLGFEFASAISRIELSLNKAQQELSKGNYANAQELVSAAIYILRLSSISLLSRVKITFWGILTIMFSIGAVLSFVLYYILNIKEKYKRHLADFQKKLEEYKRMVGEYKKAGVGIHTFEKEQLKKRINNLYNNLQVLKQKIKKEEAIVEKSEKEIGK